MKWIVVAVLFVVVVGYLFIGGAVFRTLESDNEQDTKSVSKERIKQFLANVSCVSAEQLEALLSQVINAYDQGVLVTGETETNDNWNFVSSISFSATVITTIGYGNVSPSTFGGRLFCIFYAIVGIPLCALFLAGLGQKLHRPVKWLKGKIDCSWTRVLVTFLVYLFVAGMLVVLPAVGFHRSEDWTVFESIYYCVVTLTTIGFGDFVPGTFGGEDVILRRVLMMVWIFVGLAWVSSMFSAVQDFLSDDVLTKKETEQNGNTPHIKQDKESSPEVFTTL